MRWLKNLLVIGVLIGLVYRLRRWLYAQVLRLPPVKQGVKVERALPIPMPDGVRLIADHYTPSRPGSYPTILIRSPYGRGERFGAFGFMLAFVAQRFAERGYHVVIQDTRGRFESEGEFDPYMTERADGQATLAWLSQQPWYTGVLAMWGPSYLGIVQWVIADAPEIKALVPIVTGTNLFRILYPDGAFDLALALRWLGIFRGFDRKIRHTPIETLVMLGLLERSVEPGYKQLPLTEADTAAIGAPVPYYRTWLEHPRIEDDIWRDALETTHLDKVNAAVHLVGGWYDFFLRTLLDDYAALKAAGRRPYLTIGAWTHLDPRALLVGEQVALDWYDAHLKGDSSHLREQPVRLFVMGANEWRDLAEYPPPSTPTRFYLGAPLSRELPEVDSAFDRYRYDPSDPTPAVGGTQFGLLDGGPRDNRGLERRADVLIYTSAPLRQSLEVIGSVRLELYVRSSCAYTDFFGRLCDVHPNGKSVNLCDGLFRIEPGKGDLQPDGSLRIEVDLWATAHRFLPGHALRVQISSGAHPRWSRNLNTGEPLPTATAMCVATQTIYHDREHPSAIVLPVI